MEILSPAGSPEGVIAAVQNGADAVYLGFGDFNARRSAANFTPEEFKRAAQYCRIRGVKVYVTLNTLVSDRELPQLAEQARLASRLGADALITQDLGVIRAIRQVAPEVPLHASTQMSVYNLEGVKLCAAMGFKRVVLARELSRQELMYICRNTSVETEVFVHGALCMCYSGQCYMSGVIGRRSGNRGRCAQPCRMSYAVGGHTEQYPLSLKDSCLVGYLQELRDMGVTSVKIEGRMKRPEHAAIVTGIYSKALRTGRDASEEELAALKSAFSRDGFTDGYYTGKTGEAMFGVRGEDRPDSVMFSTARRNYLNGEFQRVPVRFVGIVREGEPARLAAIDRDGHKATVEGPVPELAFHKELNAAFLQTQLHKTGGTPFLCAGVKSRIGAGLSLSAAAINDMRRRLLADLLEQRSVLPAREEGEFTPGFGLLNPADPPILTLSVTKLSQLSAEMAQYRPGVVYVPAAELEGDTRALSPFLADGEIEVAVSLPRIMHDRERKKVKGLLARARELGIATALAGNLGQLLFARELGFRVRGDYGLNVYNSQALRAVKDLGLISQTLSFELRLAEVRDISKHLDAELITYGRLPLMVTENCIVKSSTGVCACGNFSGLIDRQGVSFPVIREFGCRSVVLGSKKLFMADKRGDTAKLGLWGERLMFTTENALECVQVLRSYLGLSDYVPGAFTRGLYYRGVE